MSKLEKDLAKAQAMARFTGPINQVIGNLPKDKKYYKAKDMLRRAITEILDAACEDEAS